MPKNQFTPGPWHLREHRDGGLMLCPPDSSCVYLALLSDETPQARADAALIASAPDLLMCLKAMTTGKQNDPYWQERARAALALAQPAE